MPPCTCREVMHRFAEEPRNPASSLVKMTLFLLCLMAPTWLRAESISATIQDSSGAVIAGARIEITGVDLAQPVVLGSDGLGKFASSELKAGTYSVRVTRDGFEPLVKLVDLRGTVQLQLTLAIAQQQVTVNVPAKSLSFANSDPLYRDLRNVAV